MRYILYRIRYIACVSHTKRYMYRIRYMFCIVYVTYVCTVYEMYMCRIRYTFRTVYVTLVCIVYETICRVVYITMSTVCETFTCTICETVRWIVSDSKSIRFVSHTLLMYRMRNNRHVAYAKHSTLRMRYMTCLTCGTFNIRMRHIHMYRMRNCMNLVCDTFCNACDTKLCVGENKNYFF